MKTISQRGYLMELNLEHRSRGFGPSKAHAPQERLRGIVRKHAALTRDEKAKAPRKGTYPHPRALYQTVKDREDKIANANEKRSRAEYLNTKARHGEVWDNMDEDDPEKVLFRDRYSRLCQQNVAQRQLRDSQDSSSDQDDVSMVALPDSYFGMACQEYCLSPDVMAEYRGSCSSLRRLFEKVMTSSRFHHVLVPESPSRHSVDPKALAAFIKRNHRATCVNVFGPQVCRQKDSTIMTLLHYIHASLWRYVQGLWIDDFLEGALMLRLCVGMHDTDDVDDTCVGHMFVVVSRRLGNPRKLILTIAHGVDGSDLSLLPCAVFTHFCLASCHSVAHRLVVDDFGFDRRSLDIVIFSQTACIESNCGRLVVPWSFQTCATAT